MLKYLINLIFPRLCVCCDRVLVTQERIVCIPCVADLSMSNMHSTRSVRLKSIFYGKIEFKEAVALFYYHKTGKVSTLIHHLKYKNRHEIGAYLGDWFGSELQGLNQFKNVDLVIPVPLHKKKLKARGYNQVSLFGKRIAHYLNAGYTESVLFRESYTSSQTSKNRWHRWTNVTTRFRLSDDLELEDKHIVLVDDVITTGATLTACATELLKIPGVVLSVVVMAYTE